MEPEHRIGFSLTQAAWQICGKYDPPTLPVTPPEGRLEVTDKAWMSRFVKKAAMFYGAEMVRITRVNPLWVYKDVNVSHEYAIVCVIPRFQQPCRCSPFSRRLRRYR